MSTETEKPKRPPKVTAFELDPDVVGGNDSHPYTFGGFPGLWQVGKPMLPSALGLTLTAMRDLVDRFNLPLVEVLVHEKDASDTFEVPANHIPSGPQLVEPVQKQPELIEVNGQKIPGPTPPADPPELQPFAAAQMARDTARLRAEPLEDTLDAMGADDEARELAEDPTQGAGG